MWFYNLTVKLVLLSMVVLLAIVGHRSVESLGEYREVSSLHQQLSHQVESLRQENFVLEEEQHRLQTDYSYYEQLGREEFGMVRPNEKVYIVPLP